MQFSKAPPPILTTEAGIVICCRRLQSFNAKSPIFLTLFGIVIFVKDWKEANAAELIVVMPSLIMIFSVLVISSFAACRPFAVESNEKLPMLYRCPSSLSICESASIIAADSLLVPPFPVMIRVCVLRLYFHNEESVACIRMYFLVILVCGAGVSFGIVGSAEALFAAVAVIFGVG